jgi:hypothetical protein
MLRRLQRLRRRQSQIRRVLHLPLTDPNHAYCKESGRKDDRQTSPPAKGQFNGCEDDRETSPPESQFDGYEDDRETSPSESRFDGCEDDRQTSPSEINATVGNWTYLR